MKKQNLDTTQAVVEVEEPDTGPGASSPSRPRRVRRKPSALTRVLDKNKHGAFLLVMCGIETFLRRMDVPFAMSVRFQQDTREPMGQVGVGPYFVQRPDEPGVQAGSDEAFAFTLLQHVDLEGGEKFMELKMWRGDEYVGSTANRYKGLPPRAVLQQALAELKPDLLRWCN